MRATRARTHTRNADGQRGGGETAAETAVITTITCTMRAACATRVHEINASIFSLLATHGITLTPLKPLGAAVRGLDLRKTPPEPILDALQQAMATRGFLVFKDQGVLTGAEQVYASCFWGAREMHSTHGVHPKAPNKHIFRLSNDRSVGILGVGPQWHNDGSFMQDVFSHVGYIYIVFFVASCDSAFFLSRTDRFFEFCHL